jgi:transcription-repair coupling factor (superfamily II helicase)
VLRTLLSNADDDPQTGALARDGGVAFVSQSLRPYLIAALLVTAEARPALVGGGGARGPPPGGS